jgi:dTDP-4-amino-4,6-dideoxygalactose transaminase
VTISKNILPANPKLSYLEHKKEIDEAIERVLESGFYIMGSECDLFEKEFAQYLGVKYCIGVNSGTDAIILAIKSLELEAGSEVILPSHTSQGSLVGIYENNLKPIFCDIDQKTFNITLENVLAKITPKTKAIVGVHLYGQAFEVAKIADFCKEQKIYLIEDCAQAHGAEFNQKKVGSFGDLAAFSFYPTKNLGALGDGGAIATNNFDLAKKIQQLRQYGWEERYVAKRLGINSRLDEIQAAILRVKLKHLDSENALRAKIAQEYNNRLTNKIVKPQLADHNTHVYHQYTIKTTKREELLAFLHDRKILANILYPLALHQQPALKHFYTTQGDLENTETVLSQILCLPIYPQLTSNEVDMVINSVNQFFTE